MHIKWAQDFPAYDNNKKSRRGLSLRADTAAAITARQWQKLRFSHFLNFTPHLAANARAPRPPARSTGEFGTDFPLPKINASRYWLAMRYTAKLTQLYVEVINETLVIKKVKKKVMQWH